MSGLLQAVRIVSKTCIIFYIFLEAILFFLVIKLPYPAHCSLQLNKPMRKSFHLINKLFLGNCYYLIANVSTKMKVMFLWQLLYISLKLSKS